MYLKICVAGIVQNAFVSIDNIHQDICFNEKANDGRDIYYPITVDSHGALQFEYKGIKYYIHDMEKVSMSELAVMVDTQLKAHGGNGHPHYLTDDLFVRSMLCDGPWNTRYMVDLFGYGDKFPCKLKNSPNSEPHHGYKLEFEVDKSLMPTMDSDMYFPTKRTYTSDIFSMIQAGIIEILPSVDDGKTSEEHIDQYFAQYF